jgi:hypothetical protein
MKSIRKKSIVTFSGGEPGLHTWLDYILRHARYYCDVVKVVTNGEALNPGRVHYVDSWHIGVTYKDYAVRGFLEHSRDITVQIVVTESQSNWHLLDLVDFYWRAGIKVKLFTDFFSYRQEYLRERINAIIDHFKTGVTTRFTGEQVNRGSACSGCEKKCVTLKALWLFPDGSSSTCPQGVQPKFDINDWNKIVEEAYEAHLYKEEI